MFGLQHEIVARARPQTPGHAVAWRGARGAMRDGSTKIGPPLPEVVVDVDRWHAGGRGAALETRERRGHRFRLLDKGFGTVERQIVDHVDQQERRPCDRDDNRSLAPAHPHTRGGSVSLAKCRCLAMAAMKSVAAPLAEAMTSPGSGWPSGNARSMPQTPSSCSPAPSARIGLQ